MTRRGRNPDESKFFGPQRSPSLGEQTSGPDLFAPSPPDAAAEAAAGEREKAKGSAAVWSTRTPEARAALAVVRRELIALALARMAAARPGDVSGVTADDAFRLLQKNDPRGVVSSRVLAVVFREKGWQWTGHLVRSTRPSNHASDLRVWAWHGEPRNG